MKKIKYLLAAMAAALTLTGGIVVVETAADTAPVAEAATFMDNEWDHTWGVPMKVYCVSGYSTSGGTKRCHTGYTLKPYPGTSSYCYRRYYYGTSSYHGIILWASGGYTMRNSGQLQYIC